MNLNDERRRMRPRQVRNTLNLGLTQHSYKISCFLLRVFVTTLGFLDKFVLHAYSFCSSLVIVVCHDVFSELFDYIKLFPIY